MRPRPTICVDDVERSSSWFQRVLGLASGHGGPEYEQLLADEFPEMGFVAPGASGSASFHLVFYAENVDIIFDRAVEAGATALRPVSNQLCGDRSGTLRDPYDHACSIATHIEDVSLQETQLRYDEMMRCADEAGS